jgi:carbonic anhydrase
MHVGQLDELLNNNRAWAARVVAEDPGFFTRLAAQQKPQYLWIGCSDSRVPANQIVGVLPGEIFVHRNVANQVIHSDLNCLSVLQFAVDLLEVRHVIVCGHDGCSGVTAALHDERHGLVDNWLRHLQDVMRAHRDLLDRKSDPHQRLRLFTRLNVLNQVANVAETTIAQDAWSRGQSLAIHGWIYGLQDGLLHDLEITITGAGQAEKIMSRALQRLVAES